MKEIIKRQTFSTLSLIVLLGSLYGGTTINNAGLPTVTASVSPFPLEVSLEVIPAIMLHINFDIYNPAVVAIVLDRIAYKIFVSGRQIGAETFDQKISIPPNESKTIEYTPVFDLSLVDKKTKEIISEERGQWKISGLAYFHTPEGVLEVPIREREITYPSESYVPVTPLSRITIEVKDRSWSPIVGANITLVSEGKEFKKITSESGLAEFEIPATNYVLKVTKEGYEPYQESLDLSTPSVGGKVIQLTKSVIPEVTKPTIPEVPSIPWWQRYWYIIAGVVIISIIVPIILKLKKKPTVSS
jgi:LEA14-like dessication related protein